MSILGGRGVYLAVVVMSGGGSGVCVGVCVWYWTQTPDPMYAFYVYIKCSVPDARFLPSNAQMFLILLLFMCYLCAGCVHRSTNEHLGNAHLSEVVNLDMEAEGWNFCPSGS